MDLDHLTKHQLILVSLLISFVTSLSTGIVTVSLMDQAPPGVTRTVSQVIDRTIQQITSSQSASSVSALPSEADKIAAAISKIGASIVRLKVPGSNEFSGTALIVSKQGVVVTDKSILGTLSSIIGVLPDNTEISYSIIQVQQNGDIVFLAPSASSRYLGFTPATQAVSVGLGQAVLSLSGTSTAVLGQGIITEAPANLASSTPLEKANLSHIKTSIKSASVAAGSPLFDYYGNVLGMMTVSLGNEDLAAFYPEQLLTPVIPTLR